MALGVTTILSGGTLKNFRMSSLDCSETVKIRSAFCAAAHSDARA